MGSWPISHNSVRVPRYMDTANSGKYIIGTVVVERSELSSTCLSSTPESIMKSGASINGCRHCKAPYKIIVEITSLAVDAGRREREIERH